MFEKIDTLQYDLLYRFIENTCPEMISFCKHLIALTNLDKDNGVIEPSELENVIRGIKKEIKELRKLRHGLSPKQMF